MSYDDEEQEMDDLLASYLEALENYCGELNNLFGEPMKKKINDPIHMCDVPDCYNVGHQHHITACGIGGDRKTGRARGCNCPINLIYLCGKHHRAIERGQDRFIKKYPSLEKKITRGILHGQLRARNETTCSKEGWKIKNKLP